jgi:hypothetical protein
MTLGLLGLGMLVGVVLVVLVQMKVEAGRYDREHQRDY